MSRLKKYGNQNNELANAVDTIHHTLLERGSEIATGETVRNLVSLESLDQTGLQQVSTHIEDVMGELKHSLEGISGFEELSPAQLEAGAITMMAAGDPARYASAGYGKRVASMEGVTMIEPERSGPYGALDFRAKPSMEAFDERELRDFLPFSVAFNIQAARQDAFGEAFYPTTIITPDNPGLDLTVRRTVVFNEVRHALTGDATDFKRRNLLEGVVDHTILADESTTVVPWIAKDNSNADKFAPSADVAPWVRKIDNVEVETAPLRMDVDISLIGISQHPGLLGAGVTDSTDSLDHRVTLDNLYLKVGDSVLKFDTSRLPRSSFVKSVEGGNREMTLAFTSADLTITPETRAVDGSEPAELQALRDAGLTVKLSVHVNGTVDVETSNIRVWAAGVKVASIFDEQGVQYGLGSGTGAAIVTAFSNASMKYYDVFATRSNLNRRTRGLLVESVEYTERYPVELGAPISTPTPIGSNRDSAVLTPLVTAARIRTSNNAVTTLLNYRETLRHTVGSNRGRQPIPQIEGIGRFLVTPFFEELELDMEQIINSVTSHERAADVKAVLVDAIRELAYRMHRDSNYQPALDALTGTAGQMPELVIGTDSVMIQHLMVQGDPRTAGIGFEHTVVGTNDVRMKDQIIITFRRKSANGPDPLSSGLHAWMPELTSNIQLTRNGATVKEAAVQPRSRHINTLPVMASIRVKNLDKVLKSKVPVLTSAPSTEQPAPAPVTP